MLDIPKIYGDPILYDRRRGTPISPYKNKKETVFIETNYAILAEVPNKYDKVKVTGLGIDWYEIDDEEFLEENFYWVDYTHGIVYFHGSHQSKTVNVEYTGEGVRMFPDSRVYHTSDPAFPTIKDKFIDIDRAITVQKSRVDELIQSVPQPSEVVDLRIDHNGKIFKTAKDRVDAEQKKIEDAYFDAKGKKFDSLKLRIDSLQLATEKSFEDQSKINIDLRASIDLIPGKISLETERLEEKINGEVRLLQSQIDLVPEKINLSVRELKEDVEGQLSRQESYIDLLSDQMELKVDVDGITSAINLSKEGIRIDGRKVWITGETKIDNAAIKSAHIESLNANKIVANSLEAITINTGDLNVTGWLDITTANRGIRANYNHGNPDAYNARWYIGEYTLGYRYQKYLADVYDITPSGSRSNFLYYNETFYGSDMLKMRNYTNRRSIEQKLPPNNHLDVTAESIIMGRKWANEVYIHPENSFFKNSLSVGNLSVSNSVSLPAGTEIKGETSTGQSVGLITGRITTPSHYNTFKINPEGNRVADLTLGRESNGRRYVASKAIRERTYDLSPNVYVSPNGYLGIAISSRKHKLLIEDAKNTKEIINKLKKINMKTWFNKEACETYSEYLNEKDKDKNLSIDEFDIPKINRTYGFIAEEFHELGLEQFVSYGSDGEVVGLQESRLVAPLLEWVKILDEKLQLIECQLSSQERSM